jgi:hypothetical protein
VWAQQPNASHPAEIFQAGFMSWPFTPDCNGNGAPDDEDIADGILPDVNNNGVPDGCEAAPTITGQPSNQIACLGGAVGFSAAADGYPPPTFQWRRGTTNLVNGGNISGATSAALTIDPLGEGDAAADYNYVATNVAGSAVSDDASLTTTGVGATFSGQPASQIACPGGTVFFSVAADGCPAPTYQWRKGTTNLVNGGNISGATSATLTIQPVVSGDAATDYNCVATNYSGSATSDNASLATNGVGVTITGHPSNQIACLGGPASFSVTATGLPAPTYQWRKGTVNLVDGGNISGATTATLTINPVGPGDVSSYGYDVVVSNTCGSVYSTLAALAANGDPSIGTQPVTQTGHVGTATTFTVSATGTGTVSYRWRRNGGNLADSGNISGATTAALLINPVSRADGGTYDVVVTDNCGDVTSAPAMLWLAGDLNCDGTISYADINAFVLALQGPNEYAARYPSCRWLNADCSGDGQVSYADINPFVALLAGK